MAKWSSRGEGGTHTHISNALQCGKDNMSPTCIAKQSLPATSEVDRRTIRTLQSVVVMHVVVVIQGVVVVGGKLDAVLLGHEQRVDVFEALELRLIYLGYNFPITTTNTGCSSNCSSRHNNNNNNNSD